LRIAAAVSGEKGALDIRLIRLGRRQHRAIGDIRPLAGSIRDGGLRHPVTVSPGYGLISGRRRLAAYESLGWTVIPYRAVRTIADALPLLAEDDADTRQSLPMTIAEVIYRDWQVRDELEWWPRAGHNRAIPGTRYEHRAMLAAAAGLNSSAYTRAYTVILASEGFCRKMNHLHALEDEGEIAAARDAAKMLETPDRGVIDQAYRRYQAMLRIPEAIPAVTVGEFDAAMARLTGTVAAFSGITLPADASPETIQHWDDVMTMQVIRPLGQFRRSKIRRSDGSPA
jgi:ParB-like nuclease domain